MYGKPVYSICIQCISAYASMSVTSTYTQCTWTYISSDNVCICDNISVFDELVFSISLRPLLPFNLIQFPLLFPSLNQFHKHAHLYKYWQFLVDHVVDAGQPGVEPRAVCSSMP